MVYVFYQIDRPLISRTPLEPKGALFVELDTSCGAPSTHREHWTIRKKFEKDLVENGTYGFVEYTIAPISWDKP